MTNKKQGTLFNEIKKTKPADAKKYLEKRWEKKPKPLDPDLKDWRELVKEAFGGENENNNV